MGDRFYGAPELIVWCQQQGWGWRLRLKQDLLAFEEGGETTLAACFARGEHLLRGIGLTGKRVATHVAMVHEPGHPEPWSIALSEAPTVHRALDYGLRWGIEAMFSDFKSRGFGLEDSHLQRVERLDRLILVMALRCSGPSRPACGTPSMTPRPTKKLGWQSWLAEELLEAAEIGLGIAAELRPQHAGMATALEAGAHLAPTLPIGAGEIAGVLAAQPGGKSSDDPHRATQHRRRRVGLATGRPPLVPAVRPEQLLEPVVGARQIRHGIAVEQARTVAAAHLAAMLDRLGKRAGLFAVARHGAEQPVEATLHRRGRLAASILEDPRRLVHPSVGATDRRP
jgi:hypothetical protein